MIRKIAITGAALIAVPVAALLVYAAMQPDSFRVQRTASIKATPEKSDRQIAEVGPGSYAVARIARPVRVRRMNASSTSGVTIVG